MKKITPQQLLEIAVQVCGSIEAVSRQSKIKRSTLFRIKNATTTRPQKATLAKLREAALR